MSTARNRRYAICNELFQDWPWDRAFGFARECGYEGIEIAPFTLADNANAVSPEKRREIAELAGKHGLQIVGLHWLLAKTRGLGLTSADPETRLRTSDYLVALARLCRDLGGDVLVLGSPQQRNLPDGMSHAQGESHATEVIERAVPGLEQNRVTLAIEPLGPQEGNFLLTADSAVQLIERISSPWVRLHLDVKAMATEQFSIEENIRRHARWMVHFHANDPNRRGPGMGAVDFVPIFRALDAVNYRGWVSVEVFDYEPGVEFLARESIRYMRDVDRRLA